MNPKIVLKLCDRIKDCTVKDNCVHRVLHINMDSCRLQSCEMPDETRLHCQCRRHIYELVEIKEKT